MPPRIPPGLHHAALAFGHYVFSALLWSPAVFFVADHVFSLHAVTGQSMAPNLSPDAPLRRDRVFASRWDPTASLARGEVVVYRSPIAPKKKVIKRIVALEGDVVRTRSPGGRGELVSVPKGRIWVEGDEAFHSLDSNNYGPIPIALVQAKAKAVLWPPRRVGAVDTSESLVRRGAVFFRAPTENVKAGGTYGGLAAEVGAQRR